MGQAKVNQRKIFEQVKNRILFDDGELQLLKHTFAKNHDMVYTIRKALLQFELDANEQKAIKELSPELKTILKKVYVMEINPNVGIFQEQDFFKEVDFHQPDIGKISMEIKSRLIEREYMRQQVGLLIGEAVENKIIFKDLVPKNDYPTSEMGNVIINLSARNMIIKHIDFASQILLTSAGRPDETVEQMKERFFKDSAR